MPAGVDALIQIAMSGVRILLEEGGVKVTLENKKSSVVASPLPRALSREQTKCLQRSQKDQQLIFLSITEPAKIIDYVTRFTVVTQNRVARSQ